MGVCAGPGIHGACDRMVRTVPEGMLVCVTVAASLSAADTVKV